MIGYKTIELWKNPEYRHRMLEARRNSPLTRTHGMSKTLFYGVWLKMVCRCVNPKDKQYKDYGGRGIRCLWKNFEVFRDDMYEGYKSHIKEHGKDTTIDRIDNDGNYLKENCRWVTRRIQNQNKRRPPLKEFCAKGHPYSGENLILSTQEGRVKRRCRACSVASYTKRLKAASLEE